MLPCILLLVGPMLGEIPTQELKLTKEEQHILDLTNAARKKEGVEPLKVHSTLADAARKHARLMAQRKLVEDTIDGKGHQERLEDAGYQFSILGSNLFHGNAAADAAVTAWLKRATNRDMLLDKRFSEIGIGFATDSGGHSYICVLLAKPAQ